jgi:hypothetical protein
MPIFVELDVAYTEPAVRGDSSGGGTKTARLETGLEIRVPLFIKEVGKGESIHGETGVRGQGMSAYQIDGWSLSKHPVTVIDGVFGVNAVNNTYPLLRTDSFPHQASQTTLGLNFHRRLLLQRFI